MILKFSFEYVSTSLFLEKLLSRELKSSSLEGVLEKDKDILSLYVKAKENELEQFANDLSLNIPISLYLKDTKVEVADEMPINNYKIPDYPKRDMPPCPKCLRTALENYDPFVKCEACGYNVEKSKLIYKNFEKTIVDDNKNIFESLAKALINGAIVKVKTFSGYKSISLLNEKNYKIFQDNFELLGTDIESLNELFSFRKGELLAIGSYEKPILSLMNSFKFLKEYPFVVKDKDIKVRLGDDLMLELIAKEVKNKDEKYLIISDKIVEKDCHIELDFDQDIVDVAPLEVVVLEDGQSIVTKGERGLIPKVNEGFKNMSIKAFSNNYVAINDDAKIVTFDKDKEKDKTENSFVLEGDGLKYEASHGAFYSIIAENELLDKVIVGAYFSKNNHDKIMINSPKFGLVDYIKFDYDFPATIDELMETISSENKVSSKLVNNFKAKFPNLFDKELKFDKIGDIYKLWGVIGIILDMDKDGNVEKSAEKLIEYSLSFKGKKGPRIDYKLKRYKDKPTLDVLKVIKTSMSFALAGLDKPTLSFGVLESFAEFISNLIDDITKDYDIEGVGFNGSLFEASNLVNKFYTITKKNYNVFLNKEFTLDDTNLGYGIINAACAK